MFSDLVPGAVDCFQPFHTPSWHGRTESVLHQAEQNIMITGQLAGDADDVFTTTTLVASLATK